jgi:hypothetical protein
MTAQWKTFATIDPYEEMTVERPGVARNLAAGSWHYGRFPGGPRELPEIRPA